MTGDNPQYATIAELREKAERLRKMARSVTDEKAVAVIETMARKYEEQAARLEASIEAEQRRRKTA